MSLQEKLVLDPLTVQRALHKDNNEFMQRVMHALTTELVTKGKALIKVDWDFEKNCPKSIQTL